MDAFTGVQPRAKRTGRTIPDSGSGMALKRVAVVGASGLRLLSLRGGLMGAIRANRHAVACFANDFQANSDQALERMGVTPRALAPVTPGLSLFAERRCVAALAHDLESWRPHVVVTSTDSVMGLRAVKAARKAHAAQIVVIVSEVAPKGANEAGLRLTARMLERADLAVFHNADDPKTLKKRGVLPADLAYVIVAGGGVDLDAHRAQPLPPLGAGLVFSMISRLDTAKGVLDFCEAARLLKARAPSARFELAGPAGWGGTALKADAVARFGDCVTYRGVLDDVRPALGACHVFVYPSHAEGMPRPVLEALAAGRPVITTSVAGCRDTVDERINGCLVPPSDPVALAAAMESFLKRPDLIPSIARASRAKAERRFDAREVNTALLEAMGL